MSNLDYSKPVTAIYDGGLDKDDEAITKMLFGDCSLQEVNGNPQYPKLKKTFSKYNIHKQHKEHQPTITELIEHEHQIFIVSHDWDKALNEAADFNQVDEFDFRLPYPACCFEFQVNGRRLLFLIRETETNYNTALFLKIRDKDGKGKVKWAVISTRGVGYTDKRLINKLTKVVRATMIGLEAKIAETKPIRIAGKFAQLKNKGERTPFNSYHVVDLSKRLLGLSRLYSEEGLLSGISRYGPRFHFRRGHWRHLPNYKVWVKWCYVGTPDFGYIEKHYKL